MSEAIITEFEKIIASKEAIKEADKRSEIAQKVNALIKANPDGTISLLSSLLCVLCIDTDFSNSNSSNTSDDIFINTVFFPASTSSADATLPSADDEDDNREKKLRFRILNSFYLRQPASLRLLLRYYLANHAALSSKLFEERLFERLGADEDARGIFDDVIKELSKRPAAAPRVQQLYARYLAGPAGAALPPERYAEVARQAIEHAALSANVFCVDNLISALKKRQEDVPAGARRVLEVLARGRYADYAALVSDDVIATSAGEFVRDGRCAEKMRLLTVAAVCAEAGAGAVVPFGVLAKELDVAEDEAEAWVIRAIGAKLVAGRINQIEKAVAVTSAAQRVFEKAEWAALEKLLCAWKENITAINKLAEDQKQELNQLIVKKKEK